MTCGDDKIITAAINMSKGGAGRHKAYFINLHIGGGMAVKFQNRCLIA
jgi:hypothetical protein